MSEHVPLPEPPPPTEDRRAAAEQGPVPGPLNLSHNAEADASRPPLPCGLTELPTAEDEAPPAERQELPHLQTPRRGRRLVQPSATPAAPLTPQQRLLLFDTW